MADYSLFAQAGAVFTYGIDGHAQMRRAAYFVDQILHGAHPGDLPIEQPTGYLLVVNVRAARRFGWAVPVSDLDHAGEAIERGWTACAAHGFAPYQCSLPTCVYHIIEGNDHGRIWEERHDREHQERADRPDEGVRSGRDLLCPRLWPVPGAAGGRPRHGASRIPEAGPVERRDQQGRGRPRRRGEPAPSCPRRGGCP
ncbi:hypothetical protein GR303_21250 [Microvirga sp. SYSU G3D203]|uniref:Uncharacterized protein n=1 Tax=Microvirga arsenatis TaxID=2692265 RepID=A0ABW9Z2G1_9HYPH|nr:hypothetical protein [Microvirga arsenatis]